MSSGRVLTLILEDMQAKVVIVSVNIHFIHEFHTVCYTVNENVDTLRLLSFKSNLFLFVLATNDCCI
jgi:hypothetical protein